VLAKELAKNADVLFHAEVGDVTSVAREDSGLRRDWSVTALIDVADEELAGLGGLFPAACTCAVDSFDEWVGEAVAISKVFVRVSEGRNGFEVERREYVDAPDLIEETSVFGFTAFAFRDITRKENCDGVKFRAGQVAEPSFGMIGPSDTEDFRASGHALLELIGEGVGVGVV